MKFPSLRIEGPILSADIVEQIAEGDYPGQAPADFGLEGRVRDEIARAWTDARALWSVFSHQRERTTGDDKLGTSRTRATWVLPLLTLLGYEVEYNREAPELLGKKYAISHRAANLAGMPIHVVGFSESLDARESRVMSAHSLAQEYLNLTEDQLYALVTNGLEFRLLRDASRLVRLSYVEFDLHQMLEDDLFADFAVLFRLLHASRFPARTEDAATGILERYHQDSLENGERIRGGLSQAVEQAIVVLATGFLNAPENDDLGRSVSSDPAAVERLYHALLVMVYRLLFLLVIEERDLVFPKDADTRKRDLYYAYYSASRVRRLAEIARPEDSANQDLWLLLRQTFRFFEGGDAGAPLGISGLGGELFGPESVGSLSGASLPNRYLAECLQSLDRFYDEDTRQTIRVNYGALNVEEFGSVYEGLLEKDPVVTASNGKLAFSFKAGESRSSSGAHYTPEELTHPLIRNSLDHVLRAQLAEGEPERGLLSIKVCDPACGSGHILLNAARRIGLELARVRTRVEQPAPPDVRHAVRDAIRHCVYGVDKNPHAVELCKVALWLEAHDPGEPLSFLDHHIKCGDSVVGLARREELLDGIPDAAFKRLPGDDGTAASVGRRNRAERDTRGQIALELDEPTRDGLQVLIRGLQTVDGMPEDDPHQIEAKQVAYETLVSQQDWRRLRQLADILTAQFFIPKLEENQTVLVTDADYLRYLSGTDGKAFEAHACTAETIARRSRFFHWFIEFPDVFDAGGFDCILGNPPFLGGQKISGSFGARYLHFLQSRFPPAGAMDLVGFFFRRAFSLIRDGGSFGLIATNTIAQGGTREGSLEPIAAQGGETVFAVRSMKWPGLAAVSVSLVAIHKGPWTAPRILDAKQVAQITPYLDDAETQGNPFRLKENAGKSFQGSIVLGKGFVLEPEQARALIERDPRNKDVLFPYLNGEDLNSRPDQSPSRWVINFFDWPESGARKYPHCFKIIEEQVKHERLKVKRKVRRDNWWMFAERAAGLYRAIAPLNRVLVVALVSKFVDISECPHDQVFSHKVAVFALSGWHAFALLQSQIHDAWAWRYSSTLEGRINYSPSDCFETFPFPACLKGTPTAEAASADTVGKQYYEHRQALMLDMNLGLTKTYNLFHDPLVEHTQAGIDIIEPQLRRVGSRMIPGEATVRIEILRNLHVQMDLSVLAAYGWTDIPLGHDFHDVDFLPENDRVRFTISPAARREILKRLLELNHSYHAEEATESTVRKRKPQGKHNRQEPTLDL